MKTELESQFVQLFPEFFEIMKNPLEEPSDKDILHFKFKGSEIASVLDEVLQNSETPEELELSDESWDKITASIPKFARIPVLSAALEALLISI